MHQTSGNGARCLLCTGLKVLLFLGVLAPNMALIDRQPIWIGLAWSVVLGAPVLWALRRWCPDRTWLKPEMLIRWSEGKLYVGQPPGETRLIDWICSDAWMRWRVIPVEDIHALRLTPGYLAIYLKPALEAVDVMFEGKDTEGVRRVLAPLAHLFVEEIPR